MAPTTETAERELQLVAFRLARETYGIEIAAINEIIRPQEVTHVPRSAEDLKGIINLRGKIVPIVNLRRRLGLPEAGEPAAEARTSASSQRVIVVNYDGSLVGLEVDSVVGVLRLSETLIEKPTEMVETVDSEFVLGVGKHQDELIILLNVEAVLKPSDVNGR
ncbi:chemotaxis protein CheW [Chthonomonas calidirosea]|uniref:chemotaxis protein CheW n=1 Tax=Chthonomonas calidirosea TaxID=454171 RepID=UPI0006EC458E|nr:chemotaxis protein CheW [Chthonomonas calidirosea]CEK19965.1 CheW protein [Chthonomonas calidirosea]